MGMQATIEQDPDNFQNIFSCGEMCVECAMGLQGAEAHKYMLLAEKHFGKAHSLDPAHPGAMVRYGSVLNMKAFSIVDHGEAQKLFAQSKELFQQACEKEPENTRFKELLAAMDNAPALHQQVMA